MKPIENNKSLQVFIVKEKKGGNSISKGEHAFFFKVKPAHFFWVSKICVALKLQYAIFFKEGDIYKKRRRGKRRVMK